MKKNTKEFNANNVPSTIVVICNTFSHHLFVTAHIPPHILVRLSEIFLFWIKTTIINNTEIIICVIVNRVIIFYFLENNIEYTIFKIVKIATAIIKFMAQLISKVIPGRASILFIAFDKSQSKIALMSSAIIGYMKKRGSQRSFNTGLTNTLRSHKTIPPRRYVFQASNHAGNTTTAS